MNITWVKLGREEGKETLRHRREYGVMQIAGVGRQGGGLIRHRLPPRAGWQWPTACDVVVGSRDRRCPGGHRAMDALAPDKVDRAFRRTADRPDQEALCCGASASACIFRATRCPAPGRYRRSASWSGERHRAFAFASGLERRFGKRRQGHERRCAASPARDTVRVAQDVAGVFAGSGRRASAENDGSTRA